MSAPPDHAQPETQTPPVAPPELTVRAVLTGIVIGAVLTPANIYTGLKIGWAFNMSVAAGLLAYAFWQVCGTALGGRSWGLHENNINQTAASSAASITSSGLAAPIPALALLTGQELSWPALAMWLFTVSFIGVIVAAGIRNQMLLREKLPFPSGIVTAETMQDIHARGREATERLRLLLAGFSFAGALKIMNEVTAGIPRLAPGISLPLGRTGTGARAGEASLANLGFALDPSVLMVGFGAIAGLRVGLSALLGAIAGWGVLAPLALRNGWAEAGEPNRDASWFAPLVEWLLWPGATLMVVAALTAFAVTLMRIHGRRRSEGDAERPPPTLGARTLIAGGGIALVLAVGAQMSLFEIDPLDAILAVALSFVLAVVAARVSGETGVTPIGALGKVTQLTFGLVNPANLTANLMSANVTGGAAGQCADMMHDLRTGQIIGATPRFQIIAQLFGVLTGSLAGALAYPLLIPDPKAMLITPEWPAPAVATWKAVAEVLSNGWAAMPLAALPAMAIAAMLGVALALAEKLLPEAQARFVPSASAIGLGFVIPAWNSISLFIGASLAALIMWRFPDWGRRRLVVLAAGLIVGESLTGAGAAIVSFFL